MKENEEKNQVVALQVLLVMYTISHLKMDMKSLCIL